MSSRRELGSGSATILMAKAPHSGSTSLQERACCSWYSCLANCDDCTRAVIYPTTQQRGDPTPAYLQAVQISATAVHPERREHRYHCVPSARRSSSLRNDGQGGRAASRRAR